MTDVTPHSHLVQFYEDDGFLIDSLTRWFADGLSAGDSCIYVGTEAHRTSLEKTLSARGVDLDKLSKEGRFVCCDAAQVLSTFMVEEWPGRGSVHARYRNCSAPRDETTRSPRLRRDGRAAVG